MEQKPKEERLLGEFEPTSDAAWLAAAEKLLKGKPFDKILRTKTYEGLLLEPQYRKEVWERLESIDELPGKGSYLRGINPEGYHGTGWKIAQEIDCADPEEFNKALLHALQRGQNAVNIVIDEAGLSGEDSGSAAASKTGSGGTSISNLPDLEAALKDVRIDCLDLNIQAFNEALEYAMLLAAYCEKHDIDIKRINGCIGADPLGHLAEKGELPGDLAVSYGKMAGLTLWAKETGCPLRTIDIHTQAYHNCGASAVEELTFALATGIEYIREMNKFELEIDDIAPRMQFNLALGGNLFMEIAKLRAARQLWYTIIKEFGGSDESARLYIHARSGKFNKTKNDPYVNMLRTTIEAFAGVAGGVNSMHTACFDEIMRTSDEFSRRIARNQQIILAEESHLGHVIDPAGGSWYIEDLTSRLCASVCENLKLLEAEGCMSEHLQNGTIHEIIKKVKESRANNLSIRKNVLVGVNMYANLEEKPLEGRKIDQEALKNKLSKNIKSVDINIDHCAHSIKAAWLAGISLSQVSKAVQGENLMRINPLDQSRYAEPYEKLRQKMAAHTKTKGQAARVFLASNGPLKQSKARADFTRGFFEVGGFTVIDEGGFSTPEEAAQKAAASQAEIVVICSSDPTYPELVPVICRELKKHNPQVMLVLAGYPKDQIEAHKASGIDEFIHVRANTVEILTKAQKRAGVE